jgi:hypothetical protein
MVGFINFLVCTFNLFLQFGLLDDRSGLRCGVSSFGCVLQPVSDAGLVEYHLFACFQFFVCIRAVSSFSVARVAQPNG